MVTIRLPYPHHSTANSLYYHKESGGYGLTDASKTYRGKVKQILRRENIQPITGDVSLKILVYFPDKKKRDLDNLIKPIQDALKAEKYKDKIVGWYAFLDDWQVVDLHIKRKGYVEGGKIIAEIITRDY